MSSALTSSFSLSVRTHNIVRLSLVSSRQPWTRCYSQLPPRDSRPRLIHTHNSKLEGQAPTSQLAFHDHENGRDSNEPKPGAASSSSSSSSSTNAPLSMLPLPTILRSLMTATISSSPVLLPPSLSVMSLLADSHSAILNPDKNRLLHALLKKTFYTQFCAGETPREVKATIDGLKQIGFTGVILGYAKEVVLDKSAAASLNHNGGAAAEAQNDSEVSSWLEGTLETVRLAGPGDFVALKFTGAGREALYHLMEGLPPSPRLAKAIDDICQLSVTRGVRLLFDAEQQTLQPGIDSWTLSYMRKYNEPERAIIFGTYQTYLKAAGDVLSSHLRAAQEGGFALGVKLVRGAYIGSDPRHLIHDTKADTDAAFDGIAEALLRREWRAPLVQGDAKAFPAVGLVLASHNDVSVRRAQDIMTAGAAKTTDVALAQLQGMADEVSCDIVANMQKQKTETPAVPTAVGTPCEIKAYKYLVWGSTGECMKYLLRRAHENRDAVQRTKTSRIALSKELWRRCTSIFS